MVRPLLALAVLTAVLLGGWVLVGGEDGEDLHAEKISRTEHEARRSARRDAPGPDAEAVADTPECGRCVSGRLVGPDGAPWTGEGRLRIQPVGTTTLESVGPTERPALDGEGTFRFGSVPEGTCDVLLVTGDGPDTRILARWTVEAGDTEVALHIPPPHTGEERHPPVRLRIQGAAGEEANGWITLNSLDGAVRAFDAFRRGEYVCTAHPPNARVWIEIDEVRDANGRPLGSCRRGPIALGPGTVDIVLPPPSTVAGRVTDPYGEPVAGLVLRADAIPDERAQRIENLFPLPFQRTKADGSFAFQGLGTERQRLLMELPPTYALTEPLVVDPGSMGVRIHLRAGLEVVVRVLGPGASPVPIATVTADLLSHVGGKRTEGTNAEGEARLRGLAADQTYDLRIEPPAHRSDLAGIRLAAWLPSNLTVTLPAGRALTGWVQSADVPQAYTRFWWKDVRDTWQAAWTDHRGAFRLHVSVGSRVFLCTRRPFAETEEADPAHLVVRPTENEVVLHCVRSR